MNREKNYDKNCLCSYLIKYKKKLSREIEKDLKKINLERTSLHRKKCESETEEPNELQQLLLKGPIMSEEQFNRVKQPRRDLNKWLNRPFLACPLFLPIFYIAQPTGVWKILVRNKENLLFRLVHPNF